MVDQGDERGPTPSASRRGMFLGGATALAAAIPLASGRAQPAPPQGLLRGRSAIITGCARGIGRAIAVALAVADAGIQTFQPIQQMDDQHWHDIIDVNLTGTANTVRAVAPVMVQQNGGRIILIASSQGRHGMRDGANYSASKWGVIGLMKSAAIDLGKYHITVNAIIPGLVDTPMTRNQARWTEALKAVTPNPPQPPPQQEVMHVEEMQTPLHVPWLRPEDIAPAAVFLASDYAAMVTGANYDVSAGESAHYNA